MNREDIIRMAREAGCIGPDGGDPNGLWEPKGHENVTELMMKFAALVAAAEREACAEVCDVLAVHPEYASDITKLAAQAIRARGEK